jgi:hypothetical protein
MKVRRIPDGDSLFRHAIFPASFGSTSSLERTRFAYQKLMYFKYDKSERSLLTSLAWERYVPTIRHIHGQGCRTAFRRNQAMQERRKFKEENRSIYCGAYQLTAKAVRELASTQNLSEISSVEVAHHIEEGEIAHTDLKIVVSPNGPSIDSTKTAIIDRLWAVCYGPLRHSCDCDRERNPHPSSKLETPYGRPYRDPRSRPSRWWCVLRFRVLHWRWCASTGIRHDPLSEVPSQ